MNKTRIGIIGCGNISAVYCKAGERFPNLQIVAVADIDLSRAKARAEEFKIPKACSVKELLADPEIQIVINLTIPKVHAEIAIATLEAGKHTYGEKPLAVNREEGQKVLQVAKARNLRVGSAPDTFLGAGIQTARKVIDDGWIGEPIAAVANMVSHGPESWHPDPDFFFQPGAGPMFDMGPYYLTALVNLIGPIRCVSGSARATLPERTVGSGPKAGTTIKVNTPTHIAGVMDFANGAIGTILTTFDVWAAELPRIEIYGTAGSLKVPDPNTFGGAVELRRPGDKQWMEIPHAFAENARGMGVADMAAAIAANRPHRASGELAFHILDVMQSFLDASQSGRHVEIHSPCAKPAAIHMNMRDGQVQ